MHSHVSAAAYVPSFALASRQSRQTGSDTATTTASNSDGSVAQQEARRAEAGEGRYAMSTTAADYVPTRYALHATMQRRVEHKAQPASPAPTQPPHPAPPPRPMLFTSDEYSFLFATLSWNADLLLILLRNAASPLTATPALVTQTASQAPARLTWSQLLTSSSSSSSSCLARQHLSKAAAPQAKGGQEDAGPAAGALDVRAFPTLLEAQRQWQSEKRRRPQPRAQGIVASAGAEEEEDDDEEEDDEDDVDAAMGPDARTRPTKRDEAVRRGQAMPHAGRRRRRKGGLAGRHTLARTLTCSPGPANRRDGDALQQESLKGKQWLMEQPGLMQGTRAQSLYTIPDEAAEQLYQELIAQTHAPSPPARAADASGEEDKTAALRHALVQMGPDAMSDLYFQPWLLAQVVRNLRGEQKDAEGGGAGTIDEYYDDDDDDENDNDGDDVYDDGESEALFYLSRRSRRRYKLVPGTTGDPRRKAQHAYYGPRIAHSATAATHTVPRPTQTATTQTMEQATEAKAAETATQDGNTASEAEAKPVTANTQAPAAAAVPTAQGIEFFVQMLLRAVLIVVIVQVRLNQASADMLHPPSPHNAYAPAASAPATTLSAVERRALSFVRRYLPPFRALVTRYVMRCEVEVMRRAAQPLFLPPSVSDLTTPVGSLPGRGGDEPGSSSGSDADGGSGEMQRHERARHSAASPAREAAAPTPASALFATDWLHDVLSESSVPHEVRYRRGGALVHSAAAWAVQPLWTDQLYLSGKDAAWQPLLLELLDITRVVQCYADVAPTAPDAMGGKGSADRAACVPAPPPALPHRELLFRSLTALLTRRLSAAASLSNDSSTPCMTIEEEESESYLAYLQPYLTPASVIATTAGAGPPASLLAPLRWQLYATLPSESDAAGRAGGPCEQGTALPGAHDGGSSSGGEGTVVSQLYVTTLPLSGRLLFRWVLPAEDDSRYHLARFFEPRLFAFLQGGALPPPSQPAVMPLLLFHAQQHAQGGCAGRRESALVHCSAGMHRSCGIVVAFLLWLVVQCRSVVQAQPRLRLPPCCASLSSLQDVLTVCLRHVQAQRSMAEPIPAVVQQLRGFAEQLSGV